VTDYRGISFWMDSLDESLAPRPPLPGDMDVDVVIVGAGYTGVWTAYYLLQSDPSTRVAVVEREIAGYGASGRNGGWCSALFAASDARLAREFGLDAMHAMRRAMNNTVDEVGRVVAAEGIECHFRKSGTVSVARSAAQEAALRAEVEEARKHGIGEDDLRWLDEVEARSLMRATSVRGGTFTPHCAAIHPARLARGLAATVERLGGQIFEQTEVVDISTGSRPSVFTRQGRVSARTVVLATEGYTAQVAGHLRDMLPLYSMMIATEPLGDEQVKALGEALASGATFNDGRHLLIYGQVTADGRLAFGGRGAPYHYNSEIRPGFDRDSGVHSRLPVTLAELFPEVFPSVADVRVTHRWGGPIGIHRDWFPSVGIDRAAGVAAAGGYVGDGVATTNLAGRTLADLVLGRSTELTALPWVGHESPRWEPEPLRWLGVNGGLRLMALADRLEERSGKPSRLAAAVGRLTGH
jgi:glycine/D-amino acid oxidase-like deaminating enzyme